MYLDDIMPQQDEVAQFVRKYVTRDLFEQEYSKVFDDNAKWNAIETEASETYAWNEAVHVYSESSML